MGRDDLLLRRLYGRGSGPPGPGASGSGPRGERPRYGILPALWIVGLVLLIFASAFTAATTAALGLWTSPAERELREWGIVAPDDDVWIYHDHSAARDGSGGCLAVAGRLIRWDDRRKVAEIALPGAQVDHDLTGVTVRQGDEALICPFRVGEGADRFADELRVAASQRELEPWGPGRTDPRL